ncbi:hypothetical protein BDV93DRAFT_319163 [Ceratobasidium sp. AG-I]|nr:hypothetical protein BDV93DRAFT_319163 [Ceratobasidium sp. AG-I]
MTINCAFYLMSRRSKTSCVKLLPIESRCKSISRNPGGQHHENDTVESFFRISHLVPILFYRAPGGCSYSSHVYVYILSAYMLFFSLGAKWSHID